MPYNWKCCSLYPNNFGASALSTDQWKHVHRPVETRPLASGNTSTGQWTTTKRALFNGCLPLYSKYDLVNAKLLHACRYAHFYYIARLLAQKSLRYGRLD